jgi:hypothetical protein
MSFTVFFSRGHAMPHFEHGIVRMKGVEGNRNAQEKKANKRRGAEQIQKMSTYGF